MTEIRKLIEDNTDRYGHVLMKELVEALEQHIIKARIESLNKLYRIYNPPHKDSEGLTEIVVKNEDILAEIESLNKEMINDKRIS